MPRGRLTVAAGPRRRVDRGRTVKRDFVRYEADRPLGLDPDRLAAADDAVGRDGDALRTGTAIPHRADFNTLDNPFFWSARPERDGMGDQPRPASTSSSSTRPATTSTATAWRWTACCRTGRSCRSSRATGARASTRAARPRTARTSSCRRAGTARSRSSSCSRDQARSSGRVRQVGPPSPLDSSSPS